MAMDAKVDEGYTSVPKVANEFRNPDFIVRYKGVFDFDGLYKLVTSWIKHQKFKLYETNQKWKPPEVEIMLDCRRKKTGYKRDRIKVHFWGFKNGEVEKLEGDKVKKLWDARMKITFSSYVETGYSNYFGWERWGISKFTMVLMNFLNRYVIKKELDLVDTDVLYYELYQLHAKVKEFLQLESRGSAY
jgi:hypothetical protein